MTPDKTPSDARLQSAYDSVPAHGNQQDVHIAGLRAVLAKWGSPAPVGVEPVTADSVLADAARLDFIERHPEMSLRHRKGRWAFLGFTNYEYDLHESLRDAVDAARKQGANHD